MYCVNDGVLCGGVVGYWVNGGSGVLCGERRGVMRCDVLC